MRLKKVRTLEAPLSNPVRDANDEKKPRLRDPLLEDNDSSAVNPGTIGDDLASIGGKKKPLFD